MVVARILMSSFRAGGQEFRECGFKESEGDCETELFKTSLQIRNIKVLCLYEDSKSFK
jgi:hypothetical protein